MGRCPLEERSPLLSLNWLRYSCGAEIMNPAIRRGVSVPYRGPSVTWESVAAMLGCPCTWGQDSRHSQVSEMRSKSQLATEGGWPEAVFVPCLCWENHPRHFRNRYALDVETKTQRPDQMSSSSVRMEQPLAQADAPPPTTIKNKLSMLGEKKQNDPK